MSAGRLAPSPTGAQHLGNARTFLIAFWAARSTGKRLVLRIEDVDSPRVKPWAIEQAIEDLAWLGIDWDEGPVIQTQRLKLYENALDRLINGDLVYPCTCTRKDIEEAGSAPHFDHEPAIYPGTCSGWRNGDPMPDQGAFCWRFRLADHTVEFDDLVLGKNRCVPAEDLGDFPVTQKNGSPSYQLAVVVDDAEMGITEVVRGDDLVASTYRQLELFHALGYQAPTFAHVPLVVGTDGRRLAKRHGDSRLSHYRETGIKPEVIVDWAMQTSGLDPASFDWSDMNRSPVIVDRFPPPA
ncbi:aminoacyl-tRNA ligase [Rubripirellula amarantea]|uniref:Aminoacyl-tRNA ligase n=1 Tax=Rubripirellula amarantea TaxID=2527999 RepID=A0A5C5WRZ9_9BACT|nr:tRNA glutamyl-Q(34) synthetase GluQRS [Rubripirellula amarantea]TWT52562.1 aminoacyl-tRNA ligase [Rubripirellula amarantea]